MRPQAHDTKRVHLRIHAHAQGLWPERYRMRTSVAWPHSQAHVRAHSLRSTRLLPLARQPALPRGRYYSLDVGAVHLLGINTESPLDVAEVDETQREWIAEDLRRAATSTARRWTIAFGHRPLYTTEHRASKRGTGYLQAQLEDMFVASGVDLVVQGHVHAYQRTLPVARGVPTAKDYQSPRAPVYIVNGGAGNREANEVLPMGLPWEPAPNASAGELPLSNEISFGISTISADGIRWEQLYSSNGTRFDHFHIAK